jgi:glycerophosphoryl diester phosphodiesterase
VKKKWIIGTIALGILAVYMNNRSGSVRESGQPTLLAHRGVHQNYTHEGVTDDTCTASTIYPPQNTFIEDTIPAIEEAFRDGADVVDLDVHLTSDGRFVVFHDWNVDCRTNGHGETDHLALAFLKSLDVGYGYTPDGGRSFPLRGKGLGLMPSLDEVLQRFPRSHFVIHVKSGDPLEGIALSEQLGKLESGQRARLSVTGSDKPVAIVRATYGDVQTMSPKTLKRCLLSYEAIGWTGFTPSDCRHSVLFVPVNAGPWLWGWPNRFVARMAAVNTAVYAVDDYKKGGTKGLNNAVDLGKLPPSFGGGIWTDRIDEVGKLIKTQKNKSDAVRDQE